MISKSFLEAFEKTKQVDLWINFDEIEDNIEPGELLVLLQNAWKANLFAVLTSRQIDQQIKKEWFSAAA